MWTKGTGKFMSHACTVRDVPQSCLMYTIYKLNYIKYEAKYIA